MTEIKYPLDKFLKICYNNIIKKRHNFRRLKLKNINGVQLTLLPDKKPNFKKGW
jgi:hypothetical protein